MTAETEKALAYIRGSAAKAEITDDTSCVPIKTGKGQPIMSDQSAMVQVADLIRVFSTEKEGPNRVRIVTRIVSMLNKLNDYALSKTVDDAVRNEARKSIDNIAHYMRSIGTEKVKELMDLLDQQLDYALTKQMGRKAGYTPPEVRAEAIVSLKVREDYDALHVGLSPRITQLANDMTIDVIDPIRWRLREVAKNINGNTDVKAINQEITTLYNQLFKDMRPKLRDELDKILREEYGKRDLLSSLPPVLTAERKVPPPPRKK